MKWEEMVRWQKVVAVIGTVCATVALLLLFFVIAFSLTELSAEFAFLKNAVVWLEATSYLLMALTSFGLGLLQKKGTAKYLWLFVGAVQLVRCILLVITAVI